MNAEEVKVGMRFEFTLTGAIFEIAKVTEKRISWYTGHAHASSWGRNIMRMNWVSMRQFNDGLNSGAYKIIK